MTLQEALQWIVGAGAGIIAYAAMGLSFLDNLKPDIKRYVSLALAAAIASGAFYLQVALNYQSEPETTQAWIEALFSVVAVAIGLSQVIHGARVLARK